MDWGSWSLAIVGITLAGVIKGATGIGFATCALPALTAVLGLKSAMALVLAPTFATNFSLAMSSSEAKPLFWRFCPLYASMIPGVGFGVCLLSAVEQRTATVLLGVLLIVYAIFSLAKPTFELSLASERYLNIPVGFLNGLLTGLTGSQVIPLVPYMLSIKLEPSQAIQSINLGVLVLTTLLGGGLLAGNLVNTVLFQASILAVGPALLGVYLGARLRSHLPQSYLRRLVLMTVGLIGLKMLLS